ncbi:UDP-3-O-acyl-N-acetylglucosamine deacetylase [Caminibacter mediatlanticus TB-2]|uniref:UDP-3-O-acyl-N-acetylglucosamine deacetylase n=1 Tax=Caminibacter mediatlanticus TB-2 TaxID=391592 RepID=A0ABX5VEA3_9BACT|nr:UDP-3-O-acyl-N-acetylglucosamine deacetylase [Caminibacter mediatlanticus]QCT95261.1 UDP-3-O-acyl-N-acetylglucosamine deacetylase [Caminibacter mediatlanticus TB-2]
MKQRTIKKPVEVVGIGLHKGVPVRLRLEPLGEDSGIVFYRSDKGVSIPLKPENVIDTKMATVIGKDGVLVSTIEHLMSAVYSFGIDNLRIVLDNDEVPIMDGSAISFVMMIKEAGIEELSKNKKFIKITKEVSIEKDGKFAKLSPSKKIIFDFEINFDHPVIGREKYIFNFNTQNYIEEISKARTFGFLKEVQYLRSIGLALGGSLENAIVLDDKGILNDSLRFPDEFVRHKILDAIGDMSLLGANFIGKYEAFASGHHLNHLLTLELVKQNAFEVVEFSKDEELSIVKAFG